MADKEAGRKTGKAIVVSTTLDFCKSPTAPVGYMICGYFDKVMKEARKTFMTGQNGFTAATRITTVAGNAQGVGGGVASQVNLGYCRPKTWSLTVRVEKEFVVTHDCEMWMNCLGPEGPHNVIGKVIYVECVSKASVTDTGDIEVDESGTPPEAEAGSSESGSAEGSSDGSGSAQESGGAERSSDGSASGQESGSPEGGRPENAPPSESGAASKPSYAQQIEADKAGAMAELKKQGGELVQGLKDQYNKTAQAVENIYNDPSIVKQNLERLGNQVYDYGSAVAKDPNKLAQDGWNMVKGGAQRYYDEASKDYHILSDSVAANQPLTGLAKTATSVFGLASGARGLASTAKVLGPGVKATAKKMAGALESEVGAVGPGTDKLVKAEKARKLAAKNEGARVSKGPLLLNPPINMTPKGMKHVQDRHTHNNISKYANKSKFNPGENLEKLIESGTQQRMVPQDNGNFARVFDAGRTIGIDRATQSGTSIMTIITKPDGTLVTAFPGHP